MVEASIDTGRHKHFFSTGASGITQSLLFIPFARNITADDAGKRYIRAWNLYMRMNVYCDQESQSTFTLRKAK